MPSTSSQHRTYDLIVIGAGSGGLAAAEFGAALGATVALIEATDRLGGECLHAGCVPSKALIHAARRFQTVRDHLQPSDELVSGSFTKAMQAVRASILAVEADHDNADYYRQKGIAVYNQRAEFTSSNSVTLTDGQILTGKRFIITTGSQPYVPSIPGLDTVNFLTNESLFNLKELPKSLIIVGGGPIGCELGQALAMFGCEVTIVSHDSRLLPRDEPEAAQALETSFKALGNLTTVFNADIKSVRGQAGITVDYVVDTIAASRQAEQLLIATGRQPNTKLNLEAAGVTYNERAIQVNDNLQTSNSKIYAIGDVIGGPNFTHVAVDQAIVAVQNALLGRKRKQRPRNELVWATFTYPEIAHVGADEASLLASNQHYAKHIIDFRSIDKAVADGESGSIKILTDDKGLLLGATVIGGPAAEIISTFVLAKKRDLSIQDLGAALQAYPTYSFGLKMFANELALQTFKNSRQKKLADILRKFTLR